MSFVTFFPRLRSVLDYAYKHHIARLMVLGLFPQLLGVHPRKFHDFCPALPVGATVN